MRFPVIITNFKTYEQSIGDRALVLAEAHERVSKETGASLICAVSAFDVHLIAHSASVPIFAQHVDAAAPGKQTGFLTIEAAVAAGASGSLLNHAEHQIPLERIVETVKRAHKLDFEIVVCAENVEQAAEIALACGHAKPTAIAVEPPELIGGDVSVTAASPRIIADAVQAVNGIPLLVGAGVKTGEDVKQGLKLGAQGVLLASGVMLAQRPASALFDLASGLR